ncbi:MarR family winged helix-turn-helix transcriptional regulator [Micromonospora zhanjiangensis]|uniref:MarR family winged helix-turn-helix transcriptional regulator n=1 Tax=Micromonospora zhanjiangensis TaxID=1522057 RepID=A0ABV8KVX4_9ACTN
MSSTDKSPFLRGELTPPVRAFRLTLSLAQRLRYLMDDRLRADDLTTGQAALLTLVAALDAPSVKQVAAGLGTTHQNVAQLVRALERKGMLAVRDDPTDGRRKLLSVTEASRAYWRSRDDDDHTAVADWFAVLSDRELAVFVELAERVLSSLDATPEPTASPVSGAADPPPAR